MIINRNINGKIYFFELTLEEEQLFNNEQKIQWAKNILENYDCEEYDFDKSIYSNNELLLNIANKIEDRSLDGNGEIEFDVLKEFGIIKDEGAA